MTFYDYLYSTYGPNTPIIGSKIRYKDYSSSWIVKELKRLCDEGSVTRFSRGIYYIPTVTVLGPTLLNPERVISLKYIADGTAIYGYYSNLTLLNRLGLSTQMPYILEIRTNNTAVDKRNIVVGKQRVILRKSRIEVSADNVAAQIFLELMSIAPASYFKDYRKKQVIQFIQERQITHADISAVAHAFPDKALRTAIETELIYSIL